MSLFYETDKLTVSCYRKRHSKCNGFVKRSKDTPCPCMCHVIIQKNKEKKISDLQILDDKVCKVVRGLF